MIPRSVLKRMTQKTNEAKEAIDKQTEEYGLPTQKRTKKQMLLDKEAEIKAMSESAATVNVDIESLS